jgi:hypothetical protein
MGGTVPTPTSSLAPPPPDEHDDKIAALTQRDASTDATAT